MAQGIKDKVAIIGMGCTKFGELWDKSVDDLVLEAFTEAIADANIKREDIDALWYGTCYEPLGNGKSAIRVSTNLKLPFLPVTRVENLCATGSEALRGACYAVASGAADIAVAIGCEKLKDMGYGGLPAGDDMFGSDNRVLFPNMSGPGSFAQAATAYFEKYNIPYEEGKKALAHISYKSHQNGMKNEKAHLHFIPEMEKIINSPMIAYPLGLFDCCGVSDGAAVAVVCRADLAEKFRPDPIYIKAMQVATSSGEELYGNEWDGTYIETTRRAANRAYSEAGIKSPRDEISMLEVHDCFSITEMLTYEDLGISEPGKAKEDILNGFYDLDGKIPCQTDGGLKCFGHPIGASGLRMMYECYKQLQGKAGPRQIKNPRIALTHNLGGFPAQCVVSVCIVGNEL